MISSLIKLALLSSVYCSDIQLILEDGNNIAINSSMRRQVVSVSMSSHGKLNSSFYIESQLLSPLKNRHQIVHGPSKIMSVPEFKQELVIFNDFDGSQYWLTLKHQLKFHDKQVNFIGMRIIDQISIKDYILPTFTLPFTFLPLGSLYHCGSTLVGIRIFDTTVDISLFARSGQNSWAKPTGNWGWNWNKKDEDGVDIGRYRNEDRNGQIRINLKDGRYCKLPEHNQVDGNKGLEKSGYLSLQQVLENSIRLQISQKAQENDYDL